MNHAHRRRETAKKGGEREKVRICPNCGFRESSCWKRSFQNNPNGDIDVARIDMLFEAEPKVAEAVYKQRGQVIVVEPFAYLLNLRAIWVKRIEAQLYRDGGISGFKVPHESGRPKKEQNFQMKLSVGSASPTAPEAKNFFELTQSHRSLGQGATGAEKPDRQNGDERNEQMS